MQDFFCPKCGRRMLDGHCPRCEGGAGHSGHSKSARPAAPRPKPEPGSALTEEKVIPFDSIRPKDEPEIITGKKPEREITFAKRDERKEREEAIARDTPWKVKGLTRGQSFSAFIKFYIGKFTAFVDGLVNPPEDE